MRVYLAAPYPARDRMIGYARALRRAGITVECSWLDETYAIDATTTGPATGLTDDTVAGHCWDDIGEVRASDVVVVFTEAYLGLPKGSSGGGRHVETGIAIASGIPVIVIGPPENIFHRMGTPEVTPATDWQSVFWELRQRNKSRESRVRETD